MSPIHFAPAAAAALVPLVRRFVDHATDSLSFGDLLAKEPTDPDAPLDRSAVTADPSAELAALGQHSSHTHLRRFVERELKEFVSELQQRLARAGIDTSIAVDLKANVRGEVVVNGSHPQRAEIEAIFSENPELAGRFRQLAAAVTADSRYRAERQLDGQEFHLELAGGAISDLRFE